MNRGLILPGMLLILLFGSSCVSSQPRHATAYEGKDPLELKDPLEPLELAITVDDFPVHGDNVPGISRKQIVNDVIEALKANTAVEVYGFSNGEALEGSPANLEVLKAWLKAGYPLGNHTYAHMDLSKASAPEFIADINRMDQVLASLSSTSSLVEKRYVFRYPYLREGDTLNKRNAVRDYLKTKGYAIAQVTVDYDDWAWTDAYTRCFALEDQNGIDWLKQNVSKAAQRYLRRSQNLAKVLMGRDIKHILVIHVGAFDAITLKDILADAKAAGVTFIDLPTALADPVYAIDPSLPMLEGMTYLEQLAAIKNIDDPYEDEIYTRARLRELCKTKS